MPKVLSDFGERKLIGRFIEPLLDNPPEYLGDDAAVIPISDHESLLVTIDAGPSKPIMQMFDVGSPFNYGHLASAMSFSDIAAMGGKPVALVAACMFPRGLSVIQFRDFLRGIKSACADVGAKYVGGDTKESASIRIVTCALGLVPSKRILSRSGAKHGDLVAVSGMIGRCLKSYVSASRSRTSKRVDNARPRIDLGLALKYELHANACMDMSDGPINSSRELSKRSNATFEIDLDAIPVVSVPNGILPETWRLIVWATGGCDFELMFTFPKNMLKKALRMGCHICGEVGAGSRGARFTRKEGDLTKLADWEHYNRTGDLFIKLINELKK